MPLFKYTGRNKNGAEIDGLMDAANTAEVVTALRARNITPLNITIQQATSAIVGKAALKKLLEGRVSQQEILDFSRQMRIMIAAGVAIIKAVTQLAQSTRSKAMQQILNRIVGGLEAGKSLAATMSRWPKVFGTIYVSLIAVGEKTGHLDVAFAETEKYLETSITNKKRLITVVRYPIIVIVAIIIAMLIMNIFVVPKFATMFSRYGASLPLPTRILIASSNFLIHNWLIIIISIVVLIGVVRFVLPFKKVRYFWDKNKLKVPVVGGLIRRIVLAQFSRTLAMVLRSGVAMLKGFTLGANVTGNRYITEQLLIMRDAIDKGESVASAARRVSLFSGSALQMLEVGDSTGKLAEMLDNIAAAYEGDLDYDIHRLTDILEPILLIIIGAMIVVLALAVYLPLWDLIKVVK